MDLNSSIQSAFERGGSLQDLRSRRVTVMGLGRFGGGVGVVNFLQSQGARVTVTDLATAEDLAESLRLIDVNSLTELKLGRHDPRDFTDTDLVVVNPAVKWTNPLLALCAEAGVPLTSEINLFHQRNPARTIAVTGSVGKSTTASLIQAMLLASGVTAHLGGNIGGSLLGKLADISKADWVVLELSSFQLWNLNPLKFAPDVAVVTNLFPHHLDWHATFEAYAEAKATITRWQTSEQLCVQPADCSVICDWKSSARIGVFGSQLLNKPNSVSCSPGHTFVQKGLDLQHHSIGIWPEYLACTSQCSNVAAALAAVVLGVGLDPCNSIKALQSFRPLPDRREDLGVHQGRKFINDSKATTPEAAISAVKEISSGSVRLLLIAGGADKGADLKEFAAEIISRVSIVALLGKAGNRLSHELKQHAASVRVLNCRSLAEAFQNLVETSEPGDTVLLAPGCASYGEFLNYGERGEAFRQLVNRYAAKTGATARGGVAL